MNVLYDISWLGHTYGKSATGLSRVIETLARHLARSPGCTLTLCVGDGFDALAGALAMRREDEELRQISMVYPPISAAYHLRVRRALDAIDRGESLGFPSRVLRKILRVGSVSRWDKYGSLSRPSVDQAQIYHSPFLPFPKVIRKAPRLKRVLTVYDLIPRYFPELCAEGAPALLEATLGSLTADDNVLCISEATKADLCQELPWLDPKRVSVTYLGASSHFFPSPDSGASQRVRARYKIPPGPYLLSLSALEPRKGLEHVIQCFAQLVLQEKISDLNLVLAGAKGWKYDRIFGMLGEYGALGDRIILAGRIAEEDLSALYSGALSFVFMSLYEGFGLPVLEAMQCGSPVVASNVSSLPEVVGDAGILIAPRDSDALVQALLNLYRDANLRTTLSRGGLERAAKFSWENCTRQTIHAYEEALKL